MTCTCNESITYRKVDPSEIISVGDIIMLDPDTACVKRAVANDFEDFQINCRLIVGVCIEANNTACIPEIIDGGTSETENEYTVDGGTSLYEGDYEIIVIDTGGSSQNTREIIKVAYSGTQLVNVCGYVDLGDQLCISNHAGKAKSKDILNEEYFYTRTIGKVIKFTNNSNQVKVLLDIE